MFTTKYTFSALLCIVLSCMLLLLINHSLAVPVNRKGNFVQTYKFNAPGCKVKDLNSAELFHVTSQCYRAKYGWSSASCMADYGLVQSLCTKGCGKCDSTRKVRLNGCVSTSTESTLTACGPLALDLPDDMLWQLSYPWGDYASSCNPENLAPINIVSAKGQKINICSPVPNSSNGEYQSTVCTSTFYTTTTFKDAGCKKPVGGYYGKTTGLLRCDRYSDFKFTCNA